MPLHSPRGGGGDSEPFLKHPESHDAIGRITLIDESQGSLENAHIASVNTLSQNAAVIIRRTRRTKTGRKVRMCKRDRREGGTGFTRGQVLRWLM